MSKVLKIVDLITAELEKYGVELIPFSEFDFWNPKKTQIAITPMTMQYKRVHCSAYEKSLKIQIKILSQCKKDNDLDKLLQFVEKLGFDFLGKKSDESTCIAVDYNPIYSLKYFQEQGLFFSVLELTFSGLWDVAANGNPLG